MGPARATLRNKNPSHKLREKLFVALCIVAVALPIMLLAALLGQIAPAKAPEGSVDVVSWIERNGAQPELVVTLVPKGRVKLVAVATMTLTFGSSILFFIRDGWLQLALAAFGVTMVIWLYHIPL